MTSASEQDAYNELCAYTLTRADASFVHQHVVDAWGAQQAREGDKPIRLAFSLAGLYLHLEKGFTGRQVQLAHMRMAKGKREWTRFPLPADRGTVTAIEVMAAAPGPERDAAIDRWCASVWSAFRPLLRGAFLREFGDLLERVGVDLPHDG